MPANLLDLPPEILTRLPFGYAFLLRDARSHDKQWLEDRATIAALARTNRKLYAIFNPVLYQSLIVTNLALEDRLHLIRTIIAQPSIGKYVEDLKLDLFAQKFPLRDANTDLVEGTSAERLNASDGDWYRLLGHLVFPNTTNLKQLAVRCTRYERIPCDFNELVNAHIQGFCQGKGIGITCDAVEQLLTAPKLQNLTLSVPYINNARKLSELAPAISNVSSLSLRIVMLSYETLRNLLRFPRNLTRFEFYSASMRAPFLEGRTHDSYINYAQLHTVLQRHRHNLGTIRISFPSYDIEAPSRIFGGLSFHKFSRLVKLSIAPEMFLGWKECKHQNPHVDKLVGPVEPIHFVDCLPLCLEELTVFVQQYQRARNGVGYAYDAIRGVLQKHAQFYKLRQLELTCCKGVASCPQCRLAAITYLDRAPTVKKSEIAEIESACELAGVKFTWIEGIWEE